MQQTIGMIMQWAVNYPLSGWLFCDGRLLPIQQYQELYSIIGNMYGGDGRENFALPDMRSRIPVGCGQYTEHNTTINYLPAQKGGVEEVVLTMADLAPHTHGVSAFAGQQNVPVTGTLTVSGVSASTPTPSATDPAVAGGYSSATDSFGNNANIWNFLPAATNMVTLPAALNINVSNTANAVTLLPNQTANDAHTNIQPYLAVNYVICYQGAYPEKW